MIQGGDPIKHWSDSMLPGDKSVMLNQRSADPYNRINESIIPG
ncbi:hypothetical protein JMA_10940 [Jeotgalibacillus malaysiensis]|uniref:Uncharacterized protein n=1 Tax=Jeotgalibacillus malaysiensis TaxID=1508404 RepID=A0A0B5AK61_9BACL|nr:hypothetical protein JMA_10940 [Jeotgalibacillus malaysiensis]